MGLADTSGVIERTNSFTARCPEEQQELPGQFFWGSREDDAPVRAGILASFEPEGEAFVTFVTPVVEIMGAAD